MLSAAVAATYLLLKASKLIQHVGYNDMLSSLVLSIQSKHPYVLRLLWRHQTAQNFN